MSLTPKRPWLTFSTRTLLVAVTIVCVWLGWQLNGIHQRRQEVARIEAAGGRVIFMMEEPLFGARIMCLDEDHSKQLLFIQRLLGDRTVLEVELPTVGDRSRVHSLFPEAKLWAPGDFPRFS